MTTSEILAWLKRRGSRRNVEGMARYAITAEKVFGVSMATMKPLARRLRPDHALAVALWKTGWYEARILAVLIDEPARLTVAQMNAWVRDFDNWAICDTSCFHLFDKSPLAWGRIDRWASSPREFVKRAAFALMAGLALHDRATEDARFLALLPIIERESTDARNFVKKGVNWALRSIGHRNRALHEASMTLARRLAASDVPSARWIGKDAIRDLDRVLVRERVERRSGARANARERSSRHAVLSS